MILCDLMMEFIFRRLLTVWYISKQRGMVETSDYDPEQSITKWNKTGAAGGSGLFMASVYVEIFQKHTFLTYLAFTCSHNKCEAKKIISAKHGEV